MKTCQVQSFRHCVWLGVYITIDYSLLWFSTLQPFKWLLGSAPVLFQHVPLHPHINCDITGRLFGEKAARSANASAMCNGISRPCAGHSRQKHIWKLLSAAMTSASLGQGSSELMVSVQPVSKWLIIGWSHTFSCLNVPYWGMGGEISPLYSFGRTSQSTPLYIPSWRERC